MTPNSKLSLRIFSLLVSMLMLLHPIQVVAQAVSYSGISVPVNWQEIQIDKVEVYKAKREMVILQQGKVVKIYKMRLGFEPIGHKTTEGDGKTPEGRYVLDWRNPNSQFYKSLHVSYPNEQDLLQAQLRGVSAGGNIMIHGSNASPAGEKDGLLYNYLPAEDWTWGCIAVSNQDMDELWDNINDGTVIEIYP